MTEEAVKKKWYVVRVYSGQEKKIQEHIISEASIAGIRDKMGEILIPTEDIVEMRNGKKRTRNRAFFPGYILVEMVLDKATQHVISNAPGVISFVGPKNAPQSLRDEEVDRILGRMESKAQESLEIPFNVGDPIKIIDGPFNDFKGFIKEVNEEKHKVKVMVSIFGRSTPLELDFLQIESEK